jgi:putative DNA primase/helicase
MSNNVEVYTILSRLKNVQRRSPRQWMACCPAHNEPHPSLSIGIGDNRKVVLWCFAGCDFRDIWAALNI